MILERGTRYIVVDCGGGTVDITVHELDNQLGTLKELYKATGGPYGSVGMNMIEIDSKQKFVYFLFLFLLGVDQEFEKLINNIFGREIIEDFKMKRPAGYVDLMIAFEARKRTASPLKTNSLNVSLPFSLIDFYKKKKVCLHKFRFENDLNDDDDLPFYQGSTVEAAIRRLNDSNIKWSSQGMMRLTPEAMKRLFHSTVEKIKMAIGDVLNSPDVKGKLISSFFVVRFNLDY